jgi:hypothetical protein
MASPGSSDDGTFVEHAALCSAARRQVCSGCRRIYTTENEPAELDLERLMSRTQKIIIITGANSGLGKAASCRFAKDGWTVVLA